VERGYRSRSARNGDGRRKETTKEWKGGGVWAVDKPPDLRKKNASSISADTHTKEKGRIEEKKQNYFLQHSVEADAKL